MFKNKMLGGFTALSLALVASNASAAIDVSAAVTELTGASAPIALLGGAALVIAVLVKVYRKVRGAA